MSIEDDVRALAEVPLFSVLSTEQLRLIAFGTEHLSLNKGRELFRAGDRADCAFLILSGEVSFFEDQGMNRRITGSAPAGSLIGELALIADQKRPVGAMAADDCDIMRINRSLFRRVLDEYPDVAGALHAQLQARFADFLAKITRLESKFAD
jgi:CRP-like cAMP-binding protein